MPIIDLTMPIADHFRWPVERSLKNSFETGDTFQTLSGNHHDLSPTLRPN